jgi:hypothetical protein
MNFQGCHGPTTRPPRLRFHATVGTMPLIR